jgi:hypothetical protein
LADLTLFDLIAVAHNYFSFRYAPLYAGRLDKGCLTKKILFFSFLGRSLNLRAQIVEKVRIGASSR